jgi:hypothetical protein
MCFLRGDARLIVAKKGGFQSGLTFLKSYAKNLSKNPAFYTIKLVQPVYKIWHLYFNFVLQILFYEENIVFRFNDFQLFI